MKFQGPGGAGDGHFAVFERLAEDLESGATVFRELVKKKNPVVGEGDFTRPGVGAATEEADIGNSVVRRTKRATGDQTFAGIKEARDRVDARGFDRFLLDHIGHDGGHALGQHRLSGSRRADHETYMLNRTLL